MLFTIKNQFLTVTVSDTGAELQSILSADGTEYLWQGDPAFWGSRAPVLFPYTGRTLNGQYQMDEKMYPMGVHGFSRGHRFDVFSSEDSKIVLGYDDDSEAFASYPRHFSFRITYALENASLRVSYAVTNKDSKSIIFGLGAHPGFAVPLAAGKKYTDYRLRFASPCAPERILFDKGYRTGSTELYPLSEEYSIPLNTELFCNDAVLLTGAAKEIILEAEGDPHSVKVSSDFMPYVGFWKPYKEGAQFVCIEPWCTLPSLQGEKTVFEEQKDLIHLEPGKEFKWDWSISVF